MDIEQMAYFLSGSILLMLGFIVVAMGVVAINNIFAAYWQPVKLFTPDSWKGFYPPYREEVIDKTDPPLFEKEEVKEVKKTK